MDEESEENLDFYDFINISNGTDEDGSANSAISLALFQQDTDGTVTATRVTDFGNASNFLIADGNALVIESTFASDSLAEAKLASNILQEWQDAKQTNGYLEHHALHVTVTPLPLNGAMFMDLSILVYAAMFPLEIGWRLVMVFSVRPDDGSVLFYENEGFDIKEVTESVRLEIMKEQKEAEDEYFEAEKQKEEEEDEYFKAEKHD